MITKMWEVVNSYIPTFIANRRNYQTKINSVQSDDALKRNTKNQNTKQMKKQINFNYLYCLDNVNKKEQQRSQISINVQYNSKVNNKNKSLNQNANNNQRLQNKSQNQRILNQNGQSNQSTNLQNRLSIPITKQQKIQQLNQEIIFNFKELQNQLNKVDEFYKPIQIFEKSEAKKTIQKQKQLLRQVTKQQYIYQQLNDDIEKDRTQNQIRKKYKEIILNQRSIKYKSQLKHFPQISFQNFKFIFKQVWENKKSSKQYDKIKINGKVNKFQLNYRDIGTLKFGSWLNDNVSVNYISMMNEQLKKINSNFFILDSFFSANIFGSVKDPQIIKRSLNRKKLTPQNILIVSVNTGNHWFFVKIDDSRIHIYDSMKHEAHYYQQKLTVIKNIMNFTSWYYCSQSGMKGKRFQIEVHQNYPQQSNHYDCGVFMIFGMKDIIRGYQNQWTFDQKDCKFKRIQMAYQLLNENITGF